MLKRWNTGQDIQNFLKGVSPKSVPPFFLTLLLSWFFPLSPSLAVPISLLPTSAPLASSVISITLTRSSHLYSPDSKDLGQLTAGSVVQIRLPDEIIASLHGRTRMSNAELLSYMTNASRTAVKVISAHSHSTTRSNVALGSLNLRQLLSSDGVRLSEIKPYQPSAPARRSSTPAASVAHESDPNLARPALQARAACFKCQKPSAHGPTELHESTQRLGQAIAPRPVQNRETPPPPQASANLANITPQTLARYGQSPKVRALMAASKQTMRKAEAGRTSRFPRPGPPDWACYHWVKQSLYKAGMVPNGSMQGADTANAANAARNLRQKGFVNLLDAKDFPDGRFNYLAKNPNMAPPGAVMVYSSQAGGIYNSGDVQIRTDKGYESNYYSPRAIINQGNGYKFHLIGIMIDPSLMK